MKDIVSQFTDDLNNDYYVYDLLNKHFRVAYHTTHVL